MRTLFDKIWSDHVITSLGQGRDLLQADRHLLHDLTGPAAVEQILARGYGLRNPGLTFATPDHSVSTLPGRGDASSPLSEKQVVGLRRAAKQVGFTLFDLDGPDQGIVHVIGPELGLTLPGSLFMCADSHTCTHGALGALAWGIGSSELNHVLATQAIVQSRPGTMRVTFEGRPAPGITAKDMILALIGQIGAGGGSGYAVEYAGEAIRAMPIEGRLTICNLSIELGAKIGMIAPDDVTFEYLHGRRYAPKGAMWDRALRAWKALPTDADASFDREVTVDTARIAPQVTWGTSPQDVIGIDERVPDPGAEADPDRRKAMEAALDYMGLAPGISLSEVPVDWVFIGSCTNGRISDLREAARILRGRKVADGVKAWAVPGSRAVKAQAEAEGLDRIFLEAGVEWREAGCSMCLAANMERVPPGMRSISTTNRNFVGRQGPKARTHLASPAMAAAAAVTGSFADVRQLEQA